jgi:hypothetical protein
MQVDLLLAALKRDTPGTERNPSQPQYARVEGTRRLDVCHYQHQVVKPIDLYVSSPLVWISADWLGWRSRRLCIDGNDG